MTQKVFIHPNPFTYKITIENNDRSNEPLKLTIYDMTGTVVRMMTFDPARKEIDLSSISKGVYVVEIEFADKKIRRKILKY